MSRDFGVYLAVKNMPTTSQWKTEIINENFPAELDDDFNPLTFSGFLPCPVNGEISGFEYYASPLDADVLVELNTTALLDFDITFSTGSHPLELVSALATASCLAKLAGGILVDFQTGQQINSVEAVSWAKAVLSCL